MWFGGKGTVARDSVYERHTFTGGLRGSLETSRTFNITSILHTSFIGSD